MEPEDWQFLMDDEFSYYLSSILISSSPEPERSVGCLDPPFSGTPESFVSDGVCSHHQPFDGNPSKETADSTAPPSHGFQYHPNSGGFVDSTSPGSSHSATFPAQNPTPASSDLRSEYDELESSATTCCVDSFLREPAVASVHSQEPARQRKRKAEDGSKRCVHCQTMRTPQWRPGPAGFLCNACGLRYKSGRLLPEYRPYASPSFNPTEHSCFHRRIIKRIGSDSSLEDSTTSYQVEALTPTYFEAESSRAPKHKAEEDGSKKCIHCQTMRTPQWRPTSVGLLCNACGLRYKSGRLLPEYRPYASPSFDPSVHSSSHRKIKRMRDQVYKCMPTAPPAS